MVTFKREERFFKCPMGKAKDDAIRGRWMGNDHRQLEKNKFSKVRLYLDIFFYFFHYSTRNLVVVLKFKVHKIMY